MSEISRVKNSFKNAKVALLFYLVNLGVQFFLRKIILEYLGAEILGLNSTAMNLLQFLNIAELGISAAASYSLYKPISNKDYSSVNEIISIQGYLYRKIGIIIFFLGLVLMGFFPFIFTKIEFPFWYTYATFAIFLISALSSYFFTYQQIILISDQKEYKLIYATQGIKLAKALLQLLFIFNLENGYLWWMFWEVISVFLTTILTTYIIKMEYPWLKPCIQNAKLLLSKNPEIIVKIKQIFAHKIAAFVLNESTPLIIFSLSSLVYIAKYGNYLLVISGVTALLAAILNGMNASIGNLVSEENSQKTIQIFDELFSLRFFFATVACFSVYKLTPIFIHFWVGNQYILESSTFFLLVIVMFINIIRLTVDSFLHAYGLFKDTGAPIIEAIINLFFSITLGIKYGINGVLIGGTNKFGYNCTNLETLLFVYTRFAN